MGTKKSILKNLAKYIVTIAICLSSMLFSNNAVALTVRDNWKSDVRSFNAEMGFYVGNIYESRWCIYDSAQQFKDIYCVRSGDKNSDVYETMDLYNISSEFKSKLFASENDYKQFMWVLENMYLFSEQDWNSYRKLVGESIPLPYNTGDTVQKTLHYQDGRDQGQLSVNKNELLVKVVQNDVLVDLTKQDSGREKTNYEYGLYEGKSHYSNPQKASNEANTYAQAIVNALYKNANLSGYSVENINKYYNTDAGKVTITSRTPNASWNSNGESGSFTVKNPYHASISGINVYKNNTLLSKSDYDFIGANNTVISYNDMLNVLKNSNPYEFKIRYKGSRSNSDTLKVELNVNYGKITTAQLLIPRKYDENGNLVLNEIDENGKKNQYLINASRKTVTDTVSTEQNIKQVFDLALTKEIVTTEAKLSNGRKVEKAYNRLINIIEPDNFKTSAKATMKYYMDKSLVNVENGSKVKYRITVYNEGLIDGYAKEITDYLPTGLKMVPASQSTINSQYGWVESNGVVKTSYLSDSVIKAYDYKTLDKKYVEIECYVDLDQTALQNVNSGRTIELDNKAEITSYGYLNNGTFVNATNNTNGDRDSIQNSLLNSYRTGDNIISDIKTKLQNVIINNGDKHDKGEFSQEDDDDFERICVKKTDWEFDLALRKWIIGVNNTEINDREPSQLDDFETRAYTTYGAVMYSLVRKSGGTLHYDNKKDAVKVNVGDIVTYRIAVFNEGITKGYANEITDYLPKGLEVVTDDAEHFNQNQGWDLSSIQTVEGGQAVKTTKFAYNANSNDTDYVSTLGPNVDHNVLLSPYETFYYANMSDITPVCCKYIDIKCRVTSAYKDANNTSRMSFLTNRAEITKYEYVDSLGNHVPATNTGVQDRDSAQNTIKDNGLRLKDWYFEHGPNDVNQLDWYAGEQDDDDFETVYVDEGFNVRVVKEAEDDDYKQGIQFSFRVNNSVFNKATNSDGRTDLVNVSSTLAEDVVYISEVNVGSYPLAKILDTFELRVQKANIREFQNEITGFKFGIQGQTLKSYNIGDSATVEVTDDNNNIIEVRLEWDSANYAFKLIMPNKVRKSFDLALRKWITAVNSTELVDGNNNQVRQPSQIKELEQAPKLTTKTDLLARADTLSYDNPKNAVAVQKGDLVKYRIAVVNEGDKPGYANEITDYLPAGLEFVENNEINRANGWVATKQTDGTTVVKTTKLAKSNGTVLKSNINLSKFAGNGISANETTNALIDIANYCLYKDVYHENNVLKSYAYVDIVCKVTDNATKGTKYTNRAEITNYGYYVYKKDGTPIYYEANRTGVDRDNSVEDNIKNSLNLNSWYANTYSENKSLYPGVEDDDDFETVIVDTGYEVEIVKKSNVGNGRTLSDVVFDFTCSIDDVYKNQLQLSNKKAGDTVQIKAGDVIKSKLIYAPVSYDSFTIKEASNPNAGYVMIDSKFELRVYRGSGYAGMNTITSYSFGKEGSQPQTANLNTPISIDALDRAGNLVTLTASYNSSNGRFTITVPNNIENKTYKLKLQKVSNTTGRAISDMYFSLIKSNSSVDQTVKTNSSGMIDFGEFEINKLNVGTTDVYKIVETKNAENASKRYFMLRDNIDLYVKKKVTEVTSNGRTVEKYEIDGISFDGSNFSKNLTQQAHLMGTTEKVNITATVVNNEILVTIPNVEEYGCYDLNVKKVDNRGNVLTQNGLFKLGDLALTIKNNMYVVAEGAEISPANYTTPDTYQITEVPGVLEGYSSLVNPINVVVNKKDYGTEYGIEYVTVTCGNGNSVRVNRSESKVLTNVALKNGDKVDITIDLRNNNGNTILVTVPNSKLVGSYNVKIVKHETNSERGIGGLIFSIVNGINSRSVTTNDESGIGFASGFSINTVGEQTITITEGTKVNPTHVGLGEPIVVKVKTQVSSNGNSYEASDAYFADGTKTKDVKLMNGKYVRVTLTMKNNDTGTNVNTVSLDVPNPPITGEYKLALRKIEWHPGADNVVPVQGVSFKVNNNSTPFVTAADGKVEFASQTITKENLNTMDQYTIKELTVNANQYIKLNDNLIVQVEKALNKIGDVGTPYAPNTRYVINRIVLKTDGANPVYVNANAADLEDGVTLSGVALDDGSTVDVVVKLTESVDPNGKLTQNVVIDVPNKLLQGEYGVYIKKENASDSNKPIQFAGFSATAVLAGSNQICMVDRTDASGMTQIKNSNDTGFFPINKANYAQEDVFTITELGVYTAATGTTKNVSLLKLQSPLKLRVAKSGDGYKYAVSSITLGVDGTSNSATDARSVTLRNVALENGDTVDIVATNKTSQLNDSLSEITIYVRDKQVAGNYSLNVHKTMNNSPISGVQFQLSNINSSKLTDSNGDINVYSGSINAANYQTVDKYRITEVDNKDDLMLAVLSPFVVSVEKDIVGDKFVVKSVTVANGTQIKTVTRSSAGTNASNYVEMTNVATTDLGVTATAKIILNETNSTITINIDNPKITGGYGLKLLKVNSLNENEKLEGVKFSITDGSSTFERTTRNTGYAYIYGDDPTTSAVESTKLITDTRKDTIDITETVAKQGYDLPRYVKIQLVVGKKKNTLGTRYIIDSDTTRFDVVPTSDFSSVTDASVRTKVAEQIAMLKSHIKFNVEDSEITLTMPNEVIKGNYTIDLLKIKHNANTTVEEIVDEQLPFTIIKNGTTLVNQGSNNLSTGVLSIGTAEINGANVDTYVITENTKANSGYMKLNEPITVRVETGLNDAGTAYVLKNAYLYDSSATNSKPTTKQVTFADGTSGIAKVRIDGTNVRIVVPNKKITGSYSLRLRKTIDTTSGAGLAGVKFKVNNTVQNNTDANGYVTFWSSRDITKDNVNTPDVIEVQEIQLGSANENSYAKLKSPLKLTISKGLNSNSTAYVVTSLRLEGVYGGVTKSAVSATNALLQKVDLDDGRTVAVVAKLEGNTVLLVVPNKSISGSYNLKLKKVDSKTNEAVSGLGFNITGTANGTNIGIINGVTGSDGMLNKENGSVKSVQMSGATINAVDSFMITELSNAGSYIGLKNPITLTVNKAILNGKYVVSGVKLAQSSNTAENATNATLTNVQLTDDSTVSVTVAVNDDKNEVLVTVPNKPNEMTYDVKLAKYNEGFRYKISGAQFDVTTNNGKKSYVKRDVVNSNGEINLTPQHYTTNASNVGTTDVYDITEVVTGSNEYLKITDKLELSVSKKLDTNAKKYILENVVLSKYTNGEYSGSVTLALEESNITTKRLNGLSTVNSNITAAARLNVDRTNNLITVDIENPNVTGKYKLKIRKVDSRTGAILSGVGFSVTRPNSAVSNITTSTLYSGTTVGADYEFNDSENDVWKIYETSTIDGYYLMDNFKISVNVSKKVSDDGSKYIVKDATVSIAKTSSNSAHPDYDADYEAMLNEKTKVIVNSTGTEVLVIIPNEKSVDFHFELRKVNDRGEAVTDARFTITKPDGTGNLLTNAYLDAGGIFNRKIENIKAGKEYYIDVTETSAPSHHLSLLDGFKLRVKVVIDAQGNIDQTNTCIEDAIALDSNTSSNIEKLMRRAEIFQSRYKGDLAITFGTSDRANDTVILKVTNTYDMNKFKLIVSKQEMGSGTPIKDVRFTMAAGSINYNKTTDENGEFVVADKENLDRNESFTYTLTETSAPGSYIMNTRKAVVTAGIDENGNSYARIDSIEYLDEYSGGYVTKSYDARSDSGLVTILDYGDDVYKIHWYNKPQYAIRIYKRQYISRVSNMIAYPVLSGNFFTVYEEKNGISYTSKQISELSASGGQYVNTETASNTKYTYTIDETTIPTGYENDFQKAHIMVDLRTDNVGSIMPVKSDGSGSRIYVTPKSGQSISQQEYTAMMAKLNLTIDDQNNTVIINIANTKIEEPIDEYDIDLIKVDKYDNTETLSGVEFGVWCNNNVKKYQETDAQGNPVGSAVNPTTNSEGVAKITGIPFNATTRDYIRITELTAPFGYKNWSQPGPEITVIVNKTGLTKSSQITPSNISITVGGQNTSLMDENAIKCVKTNGRIQIIIPNEPVGYHFVLRKTDMDNVLIPNDYDYADNRLNAVFSIREKILGSTYRYIYNNTKVDDGKLSFTKTGATGRMDTYEISEIAAKDGFTNILQGYVVKVYVSTGNEGVVNMSFGAINEGVTPTNTCFCVERTSGATYYTKSQIESMLKLEVKRSTDDLDTVEFSVKNPVNYRIRLKKTDTSYRNRAIKNANMTISKKVNGSYTVIKEMNASLSNTESEVETDFMAVTADTQELLIKELDCYGPYENILAGKRIYMTVKQNSARTGDRVNYTWRIEDSNGPISSSDDIYSYVSVDSMTSPQGNTIVVTVKDPIQFTFKLMKVNQANAGVTDASFSLNGVPNRQGTTYMDTITVTEMNLNPGDIKEYRIEETSAGAQYYNVIPNQTMILKVQVQDDGSIEVYDKSYIENGVTHEGWGPFEQYLYVSKSVDARTGYTTLTVKLKNPIRYQVKVYKGDMNNIANPGSDFEIEVDGNVYRESNGSSIVREFKNSTIFTNVKVRENSSAYGYNNVLAGKELELNLRFNSGSNGQYELAVVNSKLNDFYNSANNITDGVGDYSRYITYYTTVTNNIPVLLVYLRNPTDFGIEVIKQKTDGTDFDGAKFEIRSINDNFVTTNETDPSSLSRIGVYDMEITPRGRKQFVIKETSTDASHTNILAGKEIDLDVFMNKGSDGALDMEATYRVIDSTTLQQVTDNDILQFINVEVSRASRTGKFLVRVYIKNPIKYKVQFNKKDLNGFDLIGQATVTINGVANNGYKVDTYEYGKIYDTLSFIIQETNVVAPFINGLDGNKIRVNARITDEEKIEVTSLQAISENGYLIAMTDNMRNNFTSYIDTDEDGVSVLHLIVRNPMQYYINFRKVDANNNLLMGANLLAKYNEEEYPNIRESSQVPVTIRDVGRNSRTLVEFTEIDAPGDNTFVNVLEGRRIGIITEVEIGYRVKIFKMYDMATLQDFESDYVTTSYDRDTYTLNVTIQNPVEYDFEVVKEDLNGAELSGNGLIFQVTKQGAGGFIKGNNGTSKVKFTEENLAPGSSMSYTVQEISTIAPFQNVLSGLKYNMTVTVDQNGEPTVNTQLVNNQGTAVTNNYVTYSTNQVSENGRRLIKVTIKNPLKYKVRVEKTDMVGEPLTYANVYINGASNNKGTNNYVMISQNDVAQGQVNSFTVYEDNTSIPYVNVLGNRKLQFDIRMNYDNTVSIINAFTKDGNTTTTGIANDLTPYISWDYEVEESTQIPIVVIKIKNPTEYKVRVIKQDENGNTISGADLRLKIANKNVSGDSVFDTTVRTTGEPQRAVLSEISAPSGYRNILKNQTIVFDVVEQNGTVDFSNMSLGMGEFLINMENINLLEGYLSWDKTFEQGVTVLNIRLKNPIRYDFRLFKQATDGTQLSDCSLSITKVGENGQEINTITNEDGEELKSYIFDDEINIKPGETQTFIIRENTSVNPHINILQGKYIKATVSMANDSVTDELAMQFSALLYDEGTNSPIRMDPAMNFIDYEIVQDEETGKYTINMTLKNPIQTKFEFRKVDTEGNTIIGKTVIDINGETNNGYEDKEITNLSVGDEFSFEISELSANAPLQNVLGDNKLRVNCRINSEERLELASLKLLGRDMTESDLPAELARYVRTNIYRNRDNVDTIRVELENPIEYKIKILKVAMDETPLQGTVIKAYCNDIEYTMDTNSNYIEIPVSDVTVGENTRVVVEELKAKRNYTNIFKGKKLVYDFKVTGDGEIVHEEFMMDNSKNIQETMPTQYYDISTNTDATGMLVSEVKLKNPIKYRFEVMKTDLTGNEITGRDLMINLTASNLPSTVSNINGASTVKVEQGDGNPLDSHEYTIEEVSSTGPFMNIFEGAQIKASVVTAADGTISVDTFKVVNKETGEELPASRFARYVTYQPNEVDSDGTRLIRVIMRNPITYKVKVVKELANSSLRLNGTSIQVNELLNENGASDVTYQVEDVVVGEERTFYVRENSSSGAHINLLKNKTIELKAVIQEDRNLKITSEVLVDDITGERTPITDTMKEDYRFRVDIRDENDYQTLLVTLDNPIKFNVKVVKKDATGEEILEGTTMELITNNTVVANNYENGEGIIEYTQLNAAYGDEFMFSVKELSSVRPNLNVLEDKAIDVAFTITSDERIEILNVFERSLTDNYQDVPSEFINTRVERIDGIQTLIVEITNPVEYDLDIIKNAAGIGFINNAKFKVYKEEELEFNDYVTDRRVWNTSEIVETNSLAGNYTYYISEVETPNDRYVNILDGRYIVLRVSVSGTGEVTIRDNKWMPNSRYFEIYEGDIDNRDAETTKVAPDDLAYDFISVLSELDELTSKYIINLEVVNPVRYNVEINKVDSSDTPLEGASFEIESAIIRAQGNDKIDESKNVGTDVTVSNDGTVTGTTGEDGKFGYEETYVRASSDDYYEYVIRETSSAGNQYVNPFEGYNIHFYVMVDKNGNLSIPETAGHPNTYIEKDGVEIDEEYYDFISVQAENGSIIAKIKIDVENPVRYRFEVVKQLYGDDNVNYPGAEFEIESELIASQFAKYSASAGINGVSNIYDNGVVLGTTNNNGLITFEETMARNGIYEYWISETSTNDETVTNALGDKLLKVYVKVDSDGSINFVSENGQLINDAFYIYESDRTTKVDFADTGIDELVNLYVTCIDGLYTAHVEINDPQKYDLRIIKTDKESLENLNNVSFTIKAYKGVVRAGEERVQEIGLVSADDVTQNIDVAELVTANVNGIDGIIEVNNIAFNGAGYYYFEFVENTPTDLVIYKDKSENVIVKAHVISENGKYKFDSIEVVQGEQYVIVDNTVVEDDLVITNITNERVKGSYDINIRKLSDIYGTPLNGAEFTIEAYEVDDGAHTTNDEEENENEGTEEENQFETIDLKENQIMLYRLTDDVTSKEQLVPGKIIMRSADGIFNLENIRIESLKPYILKITETKAPETYTALRDPIEIMITPEIKGEYDDAEYVIKEVSMVNGGNDGLVLFSVHDKEIGFEIKNQQFDLALRKYISSINGKDVSRWTAPEVDVTNLVDKTATTAEYYNGKLPLSVLVGKDIVYTLRVYNEGQVDGYANEIVDYLPEGLEFLPDDQFNIDRRWSYVSTESNRVIRTDYLSKEVSSEGNVIKAFDDETGAISYVEVEVKCRVSPDILTKQYLTNIAEISEYKGYDRDNVVDRDSKNKVVLPSDDELPNYKDTELENAYVPGQEDDDDFEKVCVEIFDLSLRKFITKVNDKALEGENSREPVVDITKLISGESTTAEYKHTKEPVEVGNKNLVEYTIRVYNEGTVDGYASLVKDDIPEGLIYVPENEINTTYKWKMLDEDGNETNDPRSAKFVVTDYLAKSDKGLVELEGEESNNENNNLIDNTNVDNTEEEGVNTENTANGNSNTLGLEDSDDIEEEGGNIGTAGEIGIVISDDNRNSATENANNVEENVLDKEVDVNLIKAFDKETMTTLDYRDIKIVFMVSAPDEENNIIINEAQISDDATEDDDEVYDRDSTPDKWVEGEDDQDREYLEVKYFDLALKKWVSKVIVNENGKQSIIETGHTGEENPEEAVKVDIPKESLKTIKVKFEYQIKVENEGSIPGYVKEISDYIPEGLRFVQEDNPNWKVENDKVVNSELTDTLLNPGETAEVKIVLTWVNGSDNLGLKINTAEISEDYNDYGDTDDKDSTPNNIVSGEDDIDTAPIVLAVKTGEIPTHIIVYIAALSIVLVGTVGVIVLMKKRS